VVNEFWESLPLDEINRIETMEPFDEEVKNFPIFSN
jgi:hypothetical protein